MSRRAGMKETSRITGITQYELYKGVKEGKYPHFRVGNPDKGKIIFDIDLLEERIKELMLSNVIDQEDNHHFKPAVGVRKVK